MYISIKKLAQFCCQPLLIIFTSKTCKYVSCVFLVSTGVTSGDCDFFKHAIEGQRENMIFLGKRHTAEAERQLYSYRSRKILRLFDL